VIAVAFGYIGLLFVVASYGDRLNPAQRGRAGALSIRSRSRSIARPGRSSARSAPPPAPTSTSCAIYAGPILMIGFCTPLLRRVVRLAKAQNITSIADFIGARYGKSQAVAATVAADRDHRIVPYIALQLKAVASSLETILSEDQAFSKIPIIGDMALVVTLAMAAFAVLFGTRQSDATEHQHGLMLAIATESIVEAGGLIAAGAFVTFWMFTPEELIERAMRSPEAVRAIRLRALDRQLPHHDAVVVRRDHDAAAPVSCQRGRELERCEVGRARWLFPLYLIAINLF